METLKKFKTFVDEISENNSRLYKESVLKKYSTDEDIKYYLDFLYNPYITTGISDKKLSKYSGNIEAVVSADIKSNLEQLKTLNTGSDTMVMQMVKLISITPTELQDTLYKIITKNLPLGIDAKTINKNIPRLVPTFNVMLAEKYFDKPEVVDGKEFALTTKIDGMRCIALKDSEGRVSFWSRQGQEITGLVDLEAEMRDYMQTDIALDGELVAISNSPDTYKQTMKLARTKDTEKHGLKMKVFDAMSCTEFRAQTCNTSYSQRRTPLESKYLHNIDKLKHFELLPILYQGTDTNKIIEYLDEQTSNGEEGIMINICNAPYIFDRTRQLLKVKKMKDTEVTVTGFENGTNKHSNTLGALVCNYKEDELRVGSGFTDEERDYIWTHKEEYMNKKIKVKYFEETSNAQGGISLRFPVYLGIRLEEDM